MRVNHFIEQKLYKKFGKLKNPIVFYYNLFKDNILQYLSH